MKTADCGGAGDNFGWKMLLALLVQTHLVVVR